MRVVFALSVSVSTVAHPFRSLQYAMISSWAGAPCPPLGSTMPSTGTTGSSSPDIWRSGNPVLALSRSSHALPHAAPTTDAAPRKTPGASIASR